MRQAVPHRGFVTNWDLEKTIWERIFKASLPVSPQECGLVVTEPLFNLPAIQSQMDQVTLAPAQDKCFYLQGSM